MRPATAVAVLVAGIGCLLVLTAGPRLVLYWVLVIPSVLLLHLIDGLWDLAIAIVAVILFLASVARGKLRHGHLQRIRGDSRGTIAEEEIHPVVHNDGTPSGSKPNRTRSHTW